MNKDNPHKAWPFETNADCKHCWHLLKGPIMMVVPDGHIVQSCCQCQALRTIHAEHERPNAHTHSYSDIGGYERY